MTNADQATTVRTGALALLLCASLSGCGLVGTQAHAGPETPGDGRSFSLAAGGDVQVQSELVAQARKDGKSAGNANGAVRGISFDAMMSSIKPVISKADLAICHIEPVLGKSGGPFKGHPDFVAPPQIATTLKRIGYDSCSTAASHALDHGPGGIRSTLGALDAAGLKHTGSARSPEEAARPLILDVKGVKVAHLAFTNTFTGRAKLPADKPWLVNQTSFDRIAAAEKAARAAGAEVVVLSMNWGTEFEPDPNAAQRRLARKIAEKTGIDLVIGHHAHVVQPMEKIGDTWIAYGLGNQLSRHDAPTGLSEEGAIGWFDFTEQGGSWTVRARYAPTLIEIPADAEHSGTDPGPLPQPAPGTVRDVRVVNVADALATGTGLTEEQRARYRLAAERTTGTLLNRGGADEGLRPLEVVPD
ncbi:CapA family protein [Streptomyces sp. NPDC093225]|uniref:CapA family protein n=1 Tax=Streptomyces sp. NPDC093225 TaxID=3366034 RepID=UPI00382CDCF0